MAAHLFQSHLLQETTLATGFHTFQIPTLLRVDAISRRVPAGACTPNKVGRWLVQVGVGR